MKIVWTFVELFNVRAYWLSDTEGAGKENWLVLKSSFCMSLIPRNANFCMSLLPRNSNFCMSLIPTNSVFCMSLMPEKYILKYEPCLDKWIFLYEPYPDKCRFLFQLRNIMVSINHDYPDNYCRLVCNVVCRRLWGSCCLHVGSLEWPPRHRFFLVSLCLQADAEMVPKFPSCYYMFLM